ncbi:MAG: hypothetical protein KJZ47_01415 [Gemmatimonadales bacterium]|nr:hypothetical protein [Gemmatimonadales bacterium]
MSTRLVWITLAIVAAVLVGVSALATPAAWQSTWASIAAYPWKELWAPIAAYPWETWYAANLARTQEWVGAHPAWAGGAVAAAGLLLAGLVVRRIRRPRVPKVAMPPFSAALEQAMAGPSGAAAERADAPGARPRKRHVAELALAGHPVPEIARATRLSQDAVRALLARQTGSPVRPA